MKKRFLSIIFAIIFICSLFVGCKEEETFAVTIRSNATPLRALHEQHNAASLTGTTITIDTIEVKKGGVIGNIDLGSWNDTQYRFCGWYTDESYTYQWNTATDEVNSDLTLYAKWEEIEE